MASICRMASAVDPVTLGFTSLAIIAVVLAKARRGSADMAAREARPAAAAKATAKANVATTAAAMAEQAERRRELEVAVAARKRAVPEEVRTVLDGEFDVLYAHDLDEAKRVSRVVAEWLVGAHAAAHDDPATKRLARLVLGVFRFAANMEWLIVFKDPYQSGLRAHLAWLGAPLGEAFARGRLRAVLGGMTLPRHTLVRAALGEDGALRSDIAGVVPVPAAWSFHGPAAERQRHERIFIHMLKMLAMALNEVFHAKVRDVLAEHVMAGEGIMAKNKDGSWRLTPEKGVARMEGKRLADHKPESGCRPGFNIDVLRVLGVCPSPAALKAALAALGARFEGCGRVKSGFDAEDASDRFHLRTLLANILVGFGLTFAQLVAKPGVAEMWRAHAERGERGAMPRGRWRTEAAAAWAVLASDELGVQPVRFICEVQLVLEDVYEMRKRMHEPYKGLRADGCRMLHADMLSEARKVDRDAQFTRDGDTTLKRACRDGDVAVARAMLKRGKFTEGEVGGAFVVGCVSGRVDALLPTLARWCGEAQWHEAWHRAGSAKVASEMGAAVVAALLGSVPAAGVDAVGGGGLTALRRAAEGGHVRAVQALLAAGAAVDRSGLGGETPLWAAAFEGQEAVARLLIAAGANVDRAKETGSTPLFVAAVKGHDALVAVLVEQSAGAAVDLAAGNGCTPLFVAAENGHDAAVKLLLDAGADATKSCGRFGTPLAKAGEKGHRDIVALMLAERTVVEAVPVAEPVVAEKAIAGGGGALAVAVSAPNGGGAQTDDGALTSASDSD